MRSFEEKKSPLWHLERYNRHLEFPRIFVIICREQIGSKYWQADILQSHTSTLFSNYFIKFSNEYHQNE